MHNWTWQTWQGKSYLTCDLISQPHGFFTSAFAPDRPGRLTAVLDKTADVLRTKQVHGNTVLSPAEIKAKTKILVPSGGDVSTLAEGDIQRPHADGCYSSQSGQAAWVCTADCTPALIADQRTGQVAAVHAGWQGTALKIVPVAIAKLQAQGSQLKDLRILLGPAIAGEVYQVGEDVAAEVGMSIVDVRDFANSASQGKDILEYLFAMDKSPLLPDAQPDHVRLDIRRINQLQLEQLGIASEQIATAPYCTYQSPEHFFSYRRTRLKQVQWSGIISV